MRKHSSFLLTIFLVFATLAACSPATQPVPAETPPPIETSIPLPTTTLLPASEEVEPVHITAFCTLIGKDAKTFVRQGTPIVIIWGWEAKTQAQIDDFLQNSITTISLDGKVIEGTLNSEVTQNAKSGQLEVAWFSDAGVLEVGEHALSYDVKFKKIIEDGSSTYGPGGKTESLHDECQIIVE